MRKLSGKCHYHSGISVETNKGETEIERVRERDDTDEYKMNEWERVIKL